MNSPAEDKLLRMLNEGKITPEQFKELRANADPPREMPAAENAPPEPAQMKDEGAPVAAPVSHLKARITFALIVGSILMALMAAAEIRSRAHRQREIQALIALVPELKITSLEYRGYRESPEGMIFLTGPVRIKTETYFFSAAREAEFRPTERKLLLRGNASAGGGKDGRVEFQNVADIEVDFSDPGHVEILQTV